MAERNANAQKYEGGKNAKAPYDNCGEETLTTMKTMVINENKKENKFEEKGFVSKVNTEEEEEKLEEEGAEERIWIFGGNEEENIMIMDDSENGEDERVEEEVEIENDGGKGVENNEEKDDMGIETCEESSVDLDEWPPYPWSLEHLDKQIFWEWDLNPYWDIEFKPDPKAHEDHEEIIWEDDVWNLNDIKEIPEKTSAKTRNSEQISG